MKCHKCPKKGPHKYIDKKLCKNCFTELVEKQVRKNLRLKLGIKKSSKLVVIGEPASWFVKKIITIPCKKEFKEKLSENDLKKNVTIITSETLDEGNLEFLEGIFTKLKFKKKNKRILKLFYNIPEEAIESFCKIKKINYNRQKTYEKKLIDKLENKYPGIKNSLLKSKKTIEQL